MFKVISDIITQLNAFIITINFNNGKKMNCTLMIIISNDDGRIVLSCLIQLE